MSCIFMHLSEKKSDYLVLAGIVKGIEKVSISNIFTDQGSRRYESAFWKFCEHYLVETNGAAFEADSQLCTNFCLARNV